MEPEMVLSTARSGNVPYGWNVWPMRRNRVRRSIYGWAATSLVAFAILVPVFLVTVPANFEHGDFGLFATGLLLAVLAVVAFGGLCICLYDVWRLRHADEYLLVMTPEDLVKAEPKKIIHVPMDKIGYITLRGVKRTEYRPATSPTLDDMRRQQREDMASASLGPGAMLNRIVVPKGRTDWRAYANEFVEEAKASGAVHQFIERGGTRGIKVAPVGDPS